MLVLDRMSPVVVFERRRRREHGRGMEGESQAVLFAFDVVTIDRRSVGSVGEDVGNWKVGSFVPYSRGQVTGEGFLSGGGVRVRVREGVDGCRVRRERVGIHPHRVG